MKTHSTGDEVIKKEPLPLHNQHLFQSERIAGIGSAARTNTELQALPKLPGKHKCRKKDGILEMQEDPA